MSGIYIHIPYCHSKCGYCDFYSGPCRDAAQPARLAKAIAREWRERKDEISVDSPFSTLYVGGGTPSILSLEDLAVIIDEPRVWEEATIECNPEDVTQEWITGVKELGFTRVSMGIQSFHDEALRLLGRRHDSRQAMEAAAILMNSGMIVSLDLMYGLPGQSVEQWEDDLRKLLALHPHHISAYLLSVEPGTRFGVMVRSGRLQEPDTETIQRMYGLLCRLTSTAGYYHYEISNFALPEYRAIHNSNYWRGVPYLGLGPSAHSYDGISTRRVNPPSTSRYISLIEDGKMTYDIEHESSLERLNDTIITNLRTSRGLDLNEIGSRHGNELRNLVENEAVPLIDSGELILEGGRLYIPESRWLYSDAILRKLIQV